MGLLDGVRKLVGIEEVEDEEEVEEVPVSNDMTKLTPAAERQERTYRPVAASESTVSMNTAAKFTSQWKIAVSEPTSINDCPKLVDNLKAKKPVIINLENIETDVARKIFDFLSGAVYALDGNAQKITNNIILFAPANVDVAVNDGQHKVQETYKSAWK